jgi:hypothetical protein
VWNELYSTLHAYQNIYLLSNSPLLTKARSLQDGIVCKHKHSSTASLPSGARMLALSFIAN